LLESRLRGTRPRLDDADYLQYPHIHRLWK
jgi:hypothetical protein